MFHSSVCELLLEWVPSVLNTLARCLDVVYRNADMTKPTMRFCVSVYHFVVGIVFRAVVVSEFDNALSIGPVISMRQRLWRVVGQKIEIKFGIRILHRADHFHSEELVEFNRLFRIFNPEHGMVELVLGRI